MSARPPFPPFTRETALAKVQAAEDAWNTRDPERVLHDVRNGYVTQKKAREVYRVAIDAADGDFVLNQAETRELQNKA